MLKEELHSLFDLTDLGNPTKIVGIEIDQRGESLTISQPQYVESLLRKYGLTDANPVTTPLDPNTNLKVNAEVREANRSNDYASLIGSLQYLATATRPDIAHAVSRLAAYTANPTFEHYSAAKRVLRYIKGTKTYGITYRAGSTRHVGPLDTNLFYGFSDAAFANADDNRSISGYVFLSNGGAITWGSKKQTTIALSSTEAEYVALSEASREAIWLRYLYGELGFIQKEPILLLGDNDGSIAMAKNPEFHKRTKHVDIRWHWVRELVRDGLINIVDCRDPQQTADILTKQPLRPKYVRHVAELGLSPI
jgi:Reverse transcriptase (RNA-dependent DNA polymerase)